MNGISHLFEFYLNILENSKNKSKATKIYFAVPFLWVDRVFLFFVFFFGLFLHIRFKTDTLSLCSKSVSEKVR